MGERAGTWPYGFPRDTRRAWGRPSPVCQLSLLLSRIGAVGEALAALSVVGQPMAGCRLQSDLALRGRRGRQGGGPFEPGYDEVLEAPLRGGGVGDEPIP